MKERCRQRRYNARGAYRTPAGGGLCGAGRNDGRGAMSTGDSTTMIAVYLPTPAASEWEISLSRTTRGCTRVHMPRFLHLGRLSPRHVNDNPTAPMCRRILFFLSNFYWVGTTVEFFIGKTRRSTHLSTVSILFPPPPHQRVFSVSRL